MSKFAVVVTRTIVDTYEIEGVETGAQAYREWSQGSMFQYPTESKQIEINVTTTLMDKDKQ